MVMSAYSLRQKRQIHLLTLYVIECSLLLLQEGNLCVISLPTFACQHQPVTRWRISSPFPVKCQTGLSVGPWGHRLSLHSAHSEMFILRSPTLSCQTSHYFLLASVEYFLNSFFYSKDTTIYIYILKIMRQDEA